MPEGLDGNLAHSVNDQSVCFVSSVMEEIYQPIIKAPLGAAMEAGMNEHIAKPIDIAKLKKTLAKFL